MKKILLISAMFLCSVVCFSQTSTKDSVQKLQMQADAYIDSLTKHISIADFKDYLYQKITAKFFEEGKFLELYQWFITTKYNEWMATKKK